MLNPIPAIDIIGGQCVRLSKGDYDSKKVYGDPLKMALQIEEAGFQRIHIVDLDGAKSHSVVNLPVLKAISSQTNLRIDFGGGIKSDADIQKVFENGATWATIGSVAVKEPQTFDRWLSQFGPEKIILGADTRNGLISINGWKEDAQVTLFDFLKNQMDKGIRHILCTEISRDGMLAGTAIELYREIMKRYPDCQLIASGGVSGMQDLEDLDKAGIPNVVFGKAIYEGKIDLKAVAQRFLNNK